MTTPRPISRISVIIPALDEEKLLPGLLAQLDPALRGTYALEILISDGGSRDATREIARREGALVVEHEGPHRQTIAEGRNAGARAATGEVLVFINADIRFANPTRFFDAVRTFAQHSDWAGATCAVQVFPEEERWADRLFHVGHNLYVRLLNLVGEGMGRGECQIVRASTFAETGGYRSELVAGEDYEFFRRVRRRGRIHFFSEVVVFESPRRFRKYGYLHIIWGWTRNALAVVWKKKSSSEEWEAVR